MPKGGTVHTRDSHPSEVPELMVSITTTSDWSQARITLTKVRSGVLLTLEPGAALRTAGEGANRTL